MSEDNSISWYLESRGEYEELAKIASTMLTGLLRNQNIHPLTLTCRAKEPQSLIEKVKLKQYSDPKTQISDLAGVRVIAYLESDIPKIVDVIRATFTVVDDESLDKSTELGIDRIGYRSVHFVCNLGDDRTALPEYSRYADRKFEVQVRTVLQHAWAEIEHDRNYKLAGVLPADLERRLFLIAGMLELADREFAAVTAEIGCVSEGVTEAVKIGNLDSPITTVGLHAYLALKEDDFTNLKLEEQLISTIKELPKELIDFGLKTIGDIDEIVERHKDAFEEFGMDTTYAGFIRDILILEDAQKYFDKSWKRRWNGLDYESLEFYAKYRSGEALSKILRENGVEIMGDYQIEDWEE